MSFQVAMTAVTAVMSIASGVMAMSQANAAADAAEQEANYRATMMRNEAIMRDHEAKAERQRGEFEAQQKGLEVKQALGRMEATLAGQNTIVNKGAALDLLVDTQGYGRLDALTIAHESELRARELDFEADQLRAGAELAVFAGQNEADAMRREGQGALFDSVSSVFSQVSSKWGSFGGGAGGGAPSGPGGGYGGAVFG